MSVHASANRAAHGKRHSQLQKLSAVALFKSGKNISEIARAANVSRPTVYRAIADPRFSILPSKEVDSIKSSLVGHTYQNAFRAQMHISDEKLQQSTALQLMTISAIGIDKARLMENLSTENVSFRGVAENIDNDRRKLMDALEGLK